MGPVSRGRPVLSTWATMPRYQLSGRQIAALNSGRHLRIAIPSPRDICPGDRRPETILQAYREAFQSLPNGVEIAGPRLAFLPCHMTNRGGGAPRSLQAYLGEIVDRQHIDAQPVYFVSCIVATMAMICSEAYRGEAMNSATRWPAGPIVDDIAPPMSSK